MPEFSKAAVQAIAGRLPARLNRAIGLWYEPQFWQRYLETGAFGSEAGLEPLFDPDRPLREPLIVDRLDSLPRELSILDVGAGPLTTLGKRIEGRRVEITPVDPLGDQYRKIVERRGVAPVPTLTCAGEDLLERFGPGRFDVAYARNALDHTRDALAIIRNMIAVTRPGGLVALRHNRREAERRGYTLLHAWNFDLSDDGPVLFDRRRRIVLREALRTEADVEGFLDRDFVCVAIRAA